MARSLLQVICVLCLLFSQQAAFTHATWHAHEQSLRQHGGHHKPSAHGELCKLHGLFSQVLGTAPGTIVHIALADALGEQIAQLALAIVTATPITARSRGPPSLS